ncbi:hypothetical protein B0H14DRAFT_3774750 [Mycena olivaceomarginata]|nr:hypothetical protein B0H14DRAFT_3774750 [Mycena olivaceomarginata]
MSNAALVASQMELNSWSDGAEATKKLNVFSGARTAKSACTPKPLKTVRDLGQTLLVGCAYDNFDINFPTLVPTVEKAADPLSFGPSYPEHTGWRRSSITFPSGLNRSLTLQWNSSHSGGMEEHLKMMNLWLGWLQSVVKSGENNWRRYLDHWNKTITRLDLPDDLKFPLDTHDTPAQGHSQTAGPSQLRPQPRRRARAPLSLSSSDRDVVKFDDDQHPDDAEEEEEEDKGGKGKKRAKASGGPPSKHQKH